MDKIKLDEWYSAQEAADVLGTSAKYVRTLAVQYGKFEFHKLSEHMMLYRKTGVDAYKVNRGQPGRRKKSEEQAA